MYTGMDADMWSTICLPPGAAMRAHHILFREKRMQVEEGGMGTQPFLLGVSREDGNMGVM